MAKYDPLRDHLARRAEATVVLSFAEIDRLVGGLPQSALNHRAWWSNQRGGHPQATAWQDAGRRVAEINLSAGRVWFGRG